MKSSVFIIIVLISGAAAGSIHGGVNLIIVEPYLDAAIELENNSLFESGEAQDTPEFWAEYDSFRLWQKGGQVLAGTILGTSIGALFGIVYALSRDVLPGGDVKKALVLAGIMWLVIFLVPSLKYPASLPATADGDTVVLRSILLLSMTAVSGLSAVGFYHVSKRLYGKRKLLAAAGYCILMTAVAVVMPDVQSMAVNSELLDGFRAASAVGVTVFWVAAAIILGTLWHRFEPYRQADGTVRLF